VVLGRLAVRAKVAHETTAALVIALGLVLLMLLDFVGSQTFRSKSTGSTSVRVTSFIGA